MNKINYCNMCRVFPACVDLDVCICSHCIENCNTSDLVGTIKSICEKLQTVSTQSCDDEMVAKYQAVGKAIQAICSEEKFKAIKNFLHKPLVTLEIAIAHLKSLYLFNGGLYFTSEQAKELVNKTWPSDNYKWHNLLVFMCLDLNALTAQQFTCGVCYFGNFDDLFQTPANQTNYLVERGFSIEDKESFF